MNRTALLALPLMIALFAGCSGGGTAQSLRSIADGEARTWSSDAQLIGLAGIEANITMTAQEREAFKQMAAAKADTDPENLVAAMSDPVVGDGVAPGWIFGYYGSKGLYGVVVGADGKVVYSKQVFSADQVPAEAKKAMDAQMSTIKDALNAWTVDSDRAASALAAANKTFANQVGKPDQVAVWALDPGSRTWDMVLTPAKGKGITIIASISYETAEVLSVRTMGAPVTIPVGTNIKPVTPKAIEQEAGNVRLTVGAVSASASGAFELKSNHTQGKLYFTAREAVVGAGQVSLLVTSPSGKTYSTTLSPQLNTVSSSATMTPEIGDFTVAASATTGAVQVTANVYYCTDGTPVSGGATNGACTQLSGGAREAPSVEASPSSAWLRFLQ